MSQFYHPMPRDKSGDPMYAELTAEQLREIEAFTYGLTCQSRLTPARIGVLLQALVAQYKDYRTRVESEGTNESDS